MRREARTDDAVYAFHNNNDVMNCLPEQGPDKPPPVPRYGSREAEREMCAGRRGQNALCVFVIIIMLFELNNYLPLRSEKKIERNETYV